MERSVPTAQEDLAKLGGPGALPEVDGEGSGATRALVGNYAATPGPGSTPMRTPRTQTLRGQDYILQARLVTIAWAL